MHQLAFYGVDSGEDGDIDVERVERARPRRRRRACPVSRAPVAAVKAWIQAAKADVTEASRRQVTIGVSRS